jgi:hypothetical protein
MHLVEERDVGSERGGCVKQQRAVPLAAKSVCESRWRRSRAIRDSPEERIQDGQTWQGLQPKISHPSLSGPDNRLPNRAPAPDGRESMGDTPNFSTIPALSNVTPVRRFNWTTREQRTLGKIFVRRANNHPFDTLVSGDAPAASASSASNSIIGQTTIPAAVRTSSSSCT